MSEPITSLPETVPTDDSMRNDEALKQALEEMKKYPEFDPLLVPLQLEGDVSRGAESEATTWYSKLLDVFQDRQDYEKVFDEDVPNEAKEFIEEFAEGYDPFEKEPSPEDSRSRGWGTIGTREPPLLPMSPHFHSELVKLSKHLKAFPDVLEGDGKPMECIKSENFENWGLTVKNRPAYTFVARTEVGLCNLVKWAGSPGVNKKVRVAGYRHTWSDFYSSDNEVLVMLLPIKLLTSLSARSPTMAEILKDSNLVGIQEVASDGGKSLCTVKAGTTNDMFREWCLEKWNRKWCIPFNVIMVEITVGGSNGPICHGAGFSTTTLSDLVAEFHYIDPSGNQKVISDPEQLKAASGCFGLLGICTAVTLRLDPMSMAVMNPVKLPLVLAIPPPVGYKVPSAVSMKGITPEKLEKARQDFIKRCEEDYYLEWFWFPFTNQVWVNTWKKVDNPASVTSLPPYPSKAAALWQWSQGWLGEKLVTNYPFKWFSGRTQATIMAKMALGALPDLPNTNEPIKTLTSEAIHFRRGIQNMRCRDCEWEIPIPGTPNDPKKRDYTSIQRAWWDAITVFYSRKDCPMRLALEMRLTGGSNVCLAPQRGNELGTTSIEVLTIPTTPENEWQSYLQQITDVWTSYKDSKGQLLNSRPHWAKEWHGLFVRGQPIEKYLKETAYKDAIPEFRQLLETIAQAQGTTVDAMRERFGNPSLERLIFK